MTSHPENNPRRDDDQPEPIHGQVRHSQLSARISDEVSLGSFSNGVMVLTGPFELVIDFAMRMGETQRVVSRVILPIPVARQFVHVLQENMRLYEQNFGAIPAMPRPKNPEPSMPAFEPKSNEGQIAGAGIPSPSMESMKSPNAQPSIDDIYDDLKIPEAISIGRYANAVMVRHSGTEYCFDFIANFYPRSCVTSRVYMAIPHVPPVLASLQRAMHPSTGGQTGGMPGPSAN